jgi:hypothetical protein
MKSLAIGFTLGLLVAAGICYWRQPPPGVVGQLTPEIQAKKPESVIRTVYVYRDAIKPPGASQSDDVLTAVKTKDGTATVLLDDEGHTKVILTTDPLPWLAKSRKWNGSFYAGYRGQDLTYRVTLERSVYQVKRAYISVVLSGDKGPDEGKLFAGIGVRF